MLYTFFKVIGRQIKMKKSLSERVIQNQKKTQGKRRTAKIEFITLKSDIEEALNAGCSMKAVWETLKSEEQFTFGYKSFRHYVVTIIKLEQEKTKDGATEEVKPKNSTQGFIYNSTPNLEELV